MFQNGIDQQQNIEVKTQELVLIETSQKNGFQAEKQKYIDDIAKLNDEINQLRGKLNGNLT